MLAGGGREAELAVRVLADQPALLVAGMAHHVPARERADPVLAEAEIVPAARLDDSPSVGLAPQALVHADGHVDLLHEIEIVLDGVDAHRGFDEIDREFFMPALQQPHGGASVVRLAEFPERIGRQHAAMP